MSTPAQSSDSRQMASLAHVLGIITNFVAPLIIWLMKKDTDAYAGEHAKEALNFQITAAIAYVAVGILNTVVSSFVWALFWIFQLLYLGIFVVVVWWAVLGYQAASKGESYKYPFALRLIS